MNKMSIKKDDLVIVLSGKDKGKQGKVLGTIPSESKVVVEGINMVTCHIKPRRQGEEGGIVKREAAIYASKVQVVCPKCGKAIRRQTVDEICDRVMAMPEGSKIMVHAPVVRGRKGEYVKELNSFKKSGYGRVKIDGIVYDLQEEIIEYYKLFYGCELTDEMYQALLQNQFCCQFSMILYYFLIHRNILFQK